MCAEVPTLESYCHHYMDMDGENYLVTPEKLEEFKATVPRAGPKYRLGMYFETIHDLSDFEEVHCPEEGYSSCWETETEFDSELGHFIFHNVTGDSASVICIDEAMDLLALREQRQQEQQQAILDRPQESTDAAEYAELAPGRYEDFSFDQQLEQHSDSKRSGGASRHSHHSGSDGTYDGPQETPIHTTHIMAEAVDHPEDHVYETLDNCQEHYQVYVSNESSNQPPSHVSDDSDKSSSGKRTGNSKSSSFRALFSKTRNMSHSAEQVSPTEKRKDAKRQGSFERREKGAQVAPKQYPAPIRGYGVSSSPAKRSCEKKIVASPTGTASSNSVTTPSLMIKHKGKTYIIPVVEKKKETKSKQKRVHNVICTSHPSMQSSASGASAQISRRHMSPPQTEACDGSSRRRKVQHTHQQSTSSSSSNKVTHYGML